MNIKCLSLTLLFSFSAYGMTNYDSCYQLYDHGAMYPVICLSGTMEEGVGGAGVRLTVFGTNSDRVKHCMTSTAVEFNDSKFIFALNGVKELIFENVIDTPTGRKTGNAVIGHSQLKFMELEITSVQYFQKIAMKSCY